VAEPPPPAPELAPEEEPQLDVVSEADQYATIYPRRPALIRATGGLPETVMAGLDPDPSVRPPLNWCKPSSPAPALRALDPQAEPETVAAD
jgi:hypothetical protein